MDLICIEYMGCDGTNIEKADENETGLEDLKEELMAGIVKVYRLELSGFELNLFVSQTSTGGMSNETYN
jgi:hypothetical protein